MTQLTPGAVALEPADPLWKRAPTKGDDGRPLSDFMMLIPGLGKQPANHQHRIIDAIHEVLEAYRHAVVFADLNLRLNLLWVSVRPLPGICLELPAVLHSRVPEAKLVADHSRVRRR